MRDFREHDEITAEYYEQGKGYDMSTAELNRQRGIVSRKKAPCDNKEHTIKNLIFN